MARSPRKTGGGRKRPPPSKPLRSTSPTYRARIEKKERELRRERPELTPTERRQLARGHKPPPEGEARARKAKETEKGLLHYSQKQTIRRFAEKQAAKTDDDPEELAAAMQDWARRKGFAAFQQLRDRVETMRREKRKRLRKRIFRGERDGKQVDLRVDISGRSANRDLMEQLADDWELPDWRWLFYH